MRMSARIRAGVIGFGYWGPNLVRNIHGLQSASVEAVADGDSVKRDKVLRQYPGTRVMEDGLTLIADPEIDAVCIATPASSHYLLAKAALEAGKHVLIEKPMTRTSEESRVLNAIAKQKNLVLMAGHTFVYSGAVRKIKEIIDAGELGDLYYYDSSRFNLGLLQKDMNALWDLAPHDLSILQYILKEHPVSIQAFGERHVGKEHAELAFMVLRYPSGFCAHIRCSWISPLKIRRTLIAGSRKMVVYDDTEPSEKIRIYDKCVTIPQATAEEITPQNPIYRAGDVLIPVLDQTEALKTEVSHFVDCIQQKKIPLTSGEVGEEVVRLLEAAQESMVRGSVFINL